jgi:tetratricopeptide (TPR) repeat protein
MKQKVMGTIGLALFVLAVSLPTWAGGLIKPVSKKPEAQKLIEKAWALQATEYNTANFRQCIAWMEQADKLDPNNNSILTDLSRYYWQLGDSLPKQTPEQQKKLMELYTHGKDLANTSMKIRETPDGHYWYAVNLAASLEFSSILSQAAAFPAIYSHTQYVLKHDPDYDYGAPGRLWAEILSRVPKKVVETVGQKYVDEAVREIDRSLKKFPLMIDNYVYKARFTYNYYGDKETALKLLDTALKMDPNAVPDEVTPNRTAQRTGRQLWKTITGKEYPQRQKG